MKKKLYKKLIIPSILALILILTLFGLRTNETNKSSISAEINGFKLEQNSSYGTVKIVSYDKENRHMKAAEAGHKVDAINNMAIPEAVEIEGNNYYITEIGENAFSGSKAFKTVTVPETVEKIGSGAFAKCENLAKVVLSGPAVISSDAFDTVEENPKLVLSYNGEEVKDLTELENKIIVTLNSSEVINIGKVKWTNSKAEVELSTEYEKYTMQYRVNEGAWTEGTTVSNLNLNDKVEARLAYGESTSIGYASYTVEYANDTTKPTVSLTATRKTTSTITVEATASDGQTGLNGEYKWYLGSTLKATTETNTYTFEGLTDYTSYTLKVEVSDNCANTNTASVTAKTDIILSNHTSGSLISFKNFKYNSAGYYTIDINTSAPKGSLLYQVNGYADNGWQTIANNGTISNLSKGDVVYAKITDEGSSTTGYASYTVVDNAPVINSFYDNYRSTDYIEIYYSVEDNTGIKNIEIYCDGSSQYSYSPNSTYYSNSYTIYGLSSGCSYEMKIVVTDNAGQKTERTEYMYTESSSDCNGSC